MKAAKHMQADVEDGDRLKAQEGVREMRRKLLANPVIEDFRFELEEIEG